MDKYEQTGGDCPKKVVARVAYRVRFNEPPESGSEQTEFFFSTLSAIYGRFTRQQIGCNVNHLWNRRAADGKPYVGRRCTIEAVEILRLGRSKDKES